LTTGRSTLYGGLVAFSAICISRSDGAGGEDIGRAVADRLGFRYVDEEVIDRAAELGGIDASSVSDAEQRRTTLGRLLELAEPASEVRRVTPMDDPTWRYITTESSSEALRRLIREAIKETADQGDVVIVAHAASYALADRSDCFRILVTASSEQRDSRVAGSDVRSSDQARADYLQRFYGVAAELPTHYDLVINSDRLSSSQAAELIAAIAV
jgi:cytidylate kinase